MLHTYHLADDAGRIQIHADETTRLILALAKPGGSLTLPQYPPRLATMLVDAVLRDAELPWRVKVTADASNGAILLRVPGRPVHRAPGTKRPPGRPLAARSRYGWESLLPNSSRVYAGVTPAVLATNFARWARKRNLPLRLATHKLADGRVACTMLEALIQSKTCSPTTLENVPHRSESKCLR